MIPKEIERKTFEQKFAKLQLNLRTEHGQYVSIEARWAWWGWLARAQSEKREP